MAHSLPRLAELGAAGAIHPHLAADEEAVGCSTADGSSHASSMPMCPTGAWAWPFSPGECRRSKSGLARPAEARKRDADLVAAAVTVGPRIVGRLREEILLPSDIVAIADQYAPDAPLFALVLEELEPMRRYFEELQARAARRGGGRELAELGLGSRRAWVRSSLSYAGGSSTASSTAAMTSWPPLAS